MKYEIGDTVTDETRHYKGVVCIRWDDGDICTIENDAAHPNPRRLTNHSSRAVKAHEICEDCREEFGHLDNCKGCPYVPPPAYVDSMDNKVIVEEVDE